MFCMVSYNNVSHTWFRWGTASLQHLLLQQKKLWPPPRKQEQWEVQLGKERELLEERKPEEMLKPGQLHCLLWVDFLSFTSKTMCPPKHAISTDLVPYNNIFGKYDLLGGGILVYHFLPVKSWNIEYETMLFWVSIWCAVLFAGVGSYYQTRSDQSEEDKGPASSLWCISAWDASKAQEGKCLVSCSYMLTLR